MHGMFRANGGCGYLKKPGFLMHKGPNDEVFDPQRTLIATKTLKVRIIFLTRVFGILAVVSEHWC